MRKGTCERLFKVFEIGLYSVLFVTTLTLIYTGPVQYLQEKNSRYVPSLVSIDTYRPSITVCKLFGFKTNTTNLHYAFLNRNEGERPPGTEAVDEEAERTFLHDNLFHDPSELIYKFLVLKKFLELPVNLKVSHWKPVVSDASFSGNCFTLDTSLLGDNFKENEPATLIIVLKDTNPYSYEHFKQYAVYVYDQDDHFFTGYYNLEGAQQQPLVTEANRGLSATFDLKIYHNMHNCNDKTQDVFTRCIEAHLDKTHPNCTGEDVLTVKCSNISDYFMRMLDLQHYKTLGYPKIIESTGCMLPCKRKYYKMNLNTVSERNSFQWSPEGGAVIYLAKYQDGEAPMSREVKFYSYDQLLADVGGSLGLFLGFSFVGLYRIVKEAILKKFVRMSLMVFVSTKEDLILAKSKGFPSVDLLTFHSLGYFLFDTRCLYHMHTANPKKNQHYQSYFAGKSGLNFRFNSAYLHFHHLAIIFIFTPTVLFFRRGLGDCFVGLSFLMEASTPFVCCKTVLQMIGLRSSVAYSVNACLMVATFFVFRICTVPYALWLYSSQRDKGLLETLTSLRWHCNLGSLALLLFQTYWFVRMLQWAWRYRLRSKVT